MKEIYSEKVVPSNIPSKNTILITDKTGASLQRTLTDDQLKAVKIILDQIPFGE